MTVRSFGQGNSNTHSYKTLTQAHKRRRRRRRVGHHLEWWYYTHIHSQANTKKMKVIR